MAQYARFSKINPQWERFVQQQKKLSDFRTGNDNDMVKRRAAYQKLAAEGPQIRRIPNDDEVRAVNLTIPARDGYDIPVRWYFPRNVAGTRLPLFVYYHGGGFTFGNIETGDDNCRLLCARNKLSVLNVDYRLAPEWLFPKGFEDSHDSLRWAAQHADELQADPYKGFLVGGVSAGGNLAGSLAYVARDEGMQPPITGLLLSITCCLMPQAFDKVPEWKDELLSMEQNKKSDMLDVEGYNQLIQDILKAPADDTRISFLLNPDHSRLPCRAYFQIAGLDPIRDEAFLFDRLLREKSGTHTLVHIYDGLPHGFWRFQDLPAAHIWTHDWSAGTRFLIEGGEGGTHVRGEQSALKPDGVTEYLSGVL